ncbi:unnamed protein product [Brassica oleracea]
MLYVDLGRVVLCQLACQFVSDSDCVQDILRGWLHTTLDDIWFLISLYFLGSSFFVTIFGFFLCPFSFTKIWIFLFPCFTVFFDLVPCFMMRLGYLVHCFIVFLGFSI